MRVGVKNGGCAGMAYTMEYAERSARPTKWSRTRASLLIDPKAVLFLLGTEMDFKVDKLSSHFRVQQSEPDLGLRLRRIRALTPAKADGVKGSGAEAH